MRGGAIPLLVWGAVLGVLLALNWIWEGTQIHVGLFGYAVSVAWLAGVSMWLAFRPSVGKGPPERRSELEAVPRISLGTVVAALAAMMIVYGVVFGRFLVFLGAGLLAAALARVGREMMWQARSLGEAQRRHERSKQGGE